jgi:hypothetical protein
LSNDPFRYWLPGREPLLWPGDSAIEEDKRAWKERCTAHVFEILAKPACE